MPPNPKTLILNLLQANDGAPLSAAEAVRACALFGIRENSVRVALVRLGAAGLITSSGRGAYQLGPQAAGLAQELSSWRHQASRVCDWDGSWLMVSTACLGRSDRAALRTRQRALALMGFQPLDEALYVRPNNLIDRADGVRRRLCKLGLEAAAPVFRALDLDEALDARARRLWDGQALNAAYVRTRQQLAAWLKDADQLEPEVAARESYLLGNDAIRQLVFDPLLPEPLVDAGARRAFIDTLLAFDEAGHRIWQTLLPLPATSAVASRRSLPH